VSNTNTTILGIRLENRTQNSTALQKVLSDYGCFIKSRVGLHDVDNGTCATSGTILLEIIGNDNERQEFEAALDAVDGTVVKKMAF